MTSRSPGTSCHLVGGGRSRPEQTDAMEVGSKALQLMRLDALGLRVPPAIVLGTDVCRRYHAAGRRLPGGFADELCRQLGRLEDITGARLGDRRRPLLVAVRSGAPVSMPGMMESLLNVGLNDETVHGLLCTTGNPHLAWDSYRRFVQAFAVLARGAPLEPFLRVLDAHLDRDAREPRELDAPTLREIAQENLRLAGVLTGAPFPQDPFAQVHEAVEVVLRSWHSERAVTYRRLNGLDDDLGTAVTIQTMVFGNAGARSGSGVGFTRDPATGERRPYVDFLFDAQGEDVVSGLCAVEDARLGERLPEVHAEIVRLTAALEREFTDMQDFEFTVHDGRLYLLQSRCGKRTPWAALRVALDLVDEGLIDAATALERLAALDLDAIERVELAAPPDVSPVANATPASPGIAVGRIALDVEHARKLAGAGRVLLVRDAMSTEDIAGMAVAEGILTRTGGRTSHAAVVARQLGKVCLVGCEALRIDQRSRAVRLGDRTMTEQNVLTLDGHSGRVYATELEVRRGRPLAELERVASWRAGVGASR